MFGENSALTQPHPAGPRPDVGSVLCERFVLEEKLDHGRLGDVYRAADRQRLAGIDPYVAVLVLPPEISAHPARLAAFKRELASIQTLSHPNIVDIYGFDRDGSTDFVVMEWVDGESLRNIMEGIAPELLCEEEAFGIIRAVGEALIYAHAKEIVHGDVRAEDVLVTGRREVKVLFTSACLAGSAPFAVGVSDDIRGLAALTYELLTGEQAPAGPAGGSRHGAEKPEQLKSLSRKRWKALATGLGLRGERFRTVGQFLAAFGLGEKAKLKPLKRRRSVNLDAGRHVLKRAVLTAGLIAAAVAAIVAAERLWRIGLPSPAEVSAWGSAAPISSIRRQAGAAANAVKAAVQGAATTAGDAVARLREAGEATGGNAASEPGTEPRQEAAEAGNGPAIPEGELPVGARGTPITGAETGAETASSDERDPGGGETRTDAASSEERDAGSALDSDSARVETAAIGAAPPAGVSPPQAAAREERSRPAAANEIPAAQSESSVEAGGSDARAPADADASAATPTGEARANAGAALEEPTAADEASAPAADSAGADAGFVSFSQEDVVAAESQSFATIRIERRDAEGSVSIVWWLRDGTARAGDDYADLGRVVEEFRPGEVRRTLFVPITSDAIVEDREYFDVYLGTLSEEGTQNGGIQTARVTIVDDDG